MRINILFEALTGETEKALSLKNANVENIYVYDNHIDIEYSESRNGITITGNICIDEKYLNDNRIVIEKQ